MPMHSALKLNMMRGMLSQDNGYKPKLEVLIGLYREHECTDPRDRIFRLLGLAEKNETLQITPDYESPVQQVAENVMGKMYEKGSGEGAFNALLRYPGITPIMGPRLDR